jgi:ABC-type Na+ efflux pump permease subunit
MKWNSHGFYICLVFRKLKNYLFKPQELACTCMNLILIAKWEVLRSCKKVNFRSLLFLAFLSLFLIIFLAKAMGSGLGVFQGVYTLGIEGREPVLEASVLGDGRFSVAEVDDALPLVRRGKLDLLIINRGEFQEVHVSGDGKAQGALNALDQAVSKFKLEMIWFVPFEHVNSAYPLWVQTHYLERQTEFQYTALGPGEDGREDRILEEIKEIAPTPLDEAEHAQLLVEVRGELSRGRTLNVFAEKPAVTLPSMLSPPIPLRSALASFLFAIPLYMLSQLYSSSMMEERLNRTAQLLLASPLKRRDLILGKTLVHFILSLATLIVVLLAINGSIDLVIMALLVPVILFFLSISFFSSVVSRSFKENSFLIIFLSVVFFAYLFFPAMFVDVHVASKVSPISLIVKRLEGELVYSGEYVFSTLPLYLSSVVVFLFGTYLYRDEDLFTQKGVMPKLLDAVAELWRNLTGGLIGIFALGGALVPIAYLLELVLLVLLFQAPLPYSVAAMLLLSAFIEESLKIFGVIAILRRTKLSAVAVLGYAALAGAGFFTGEKVLALLALSQITDSLFGAAMFMRGYLLTALLLQASFTILSALGLLMSKGKPDRRFLAFLGLSASLHAAYNAYLVGWL